MAGKRKSIELLARGLIIRDGLVLLAHRKGAANTYLPGGHIERGEPARLALERELLEETGLRFRIGALVGVVEHSFISKKQRIHEINLIFRATRTGMPKSIASRENKIEFLWHSIQNLRRINLQPYPLQRLLPKKLKRRVPFWAGTIEQGAF